MLHGREHVERYIATDGKEGHDWVRGAPVLLLTTIGRRSGRPYTTPLIYQPNDGDYLIVASHGGSDSPPDWYVNLTANPQVEVQIWGDRFRARARTANPEEKPALWRKLLAVWPDYDEYQKRTRRQLPVIVLEPVGQPAG